MNYRKFGKLTWEASALGFGCMRLPVYKNTNELNQPLSKGMIRYAIDHGVNYIDTAYTYHQGKSEVIVGEALNDGYREKVKVATKMPSFLIQSRQDMNKYFDEQIKRLRLNYIDFYLLHGLNSSQWSKLRKLDVIDWLERKMAKGVIKHVGFSFHDNFDVFKEIIDSYSGWTFSQIQYNYMDVDAQAGKRGLEYAASKGLGLVVMEPLAGGKLAVPQPKEVKSLWETAEIKRSPVEWALRWVWNHPQVSVVLSGMSTLNQVIENLEIANKSKPSIMIENEFAIVEHVKEKYNELGFIKCSGCGYCLPCPKGVDIPTILAIYHDYRLMGKPKNIKSKYWENISPKSQARRCVGCGQCEDLCPQKMAVRSALSEASLVFESGDGQISCYPKWGLRLVKKHLRKVVTRAKSDFQSKD